MVSNASEDLPDPLGPVNTTTLPRGKDTETFFRLCWRAPTTTSRSMEGGTVSTERRAASQGERALEICPEIRCTFDANAQPEKAVGDGALLAIGPGHGRVGGRRRMHEEASHV